MADHGLTLSYAARHFAQSLSPEQFLAAQEAMRFARWLGETRPAAEVRPPDVESYVDSFSASAPNAAARADSLKAFLAYAHKQGLMPERMVSHVRIRRPQPRAKGPAAAAPEQRPQMAVTREGIAALQIELEELRAHRPRIASELRDAMADKDFRENAPLDAAREAQGQLEARIRELEATLRYAVVADGPALGEAARVGSAVALVNIATGARQTYVLVSPAEARPALGRLSVESPVGQAVVGRQAGEVVEVQAPSGSVKFRIESIES